MFPFLNIFGLHIPMYGLLLAAGFLICGFLAFFRTRKRGMVGENLIIIAAFLFGFAMLGGMLFYVFVTYTPEEIWALIRAGNWTALSGIVFYGAVIGGIIGAFLGSKVAKDDLRDYMDIIVPLIPLGHAIGRIGCFCAGCCYGRPTDSPIGIVYTHPVTDTPTGIPLLPVPLFEAAFNLLLFGFLMVLSARTRSRYLTTFWYCLLYGAGRFVLEFFRYDSIRGMAGGLSTSQWISLGLIAGALIAALLYKGYQRGKRAAA